MTTGPAGLPPHAPAVCVRHPDRATGLACSRCGRPSCPECLREASVGYQCVDCVREGSRGVRTAVTAAGARVGTRPLAVPVLIAVNLLAFVGTAAQAGSIADNYASELFLRFVLVPDAVAGGEWWRLISSGFLHFGPLHIAFNMLALWMLGRDMEVLLGRTRFLAVYFLGMLGGSAAVMLLLPGRSFVAGASGAVFAVMGGLLVALLRLRRPVNQAVGLIAVNLVLGFVVPGISWQAHLGGLVTGAAATAILLWAPPSNRTRTQTAGLTLLTVLLLLTITAAAAL